MRNPWWVLRSSFPPTLLTGLYVARGLHLLLLLPEFVERHHHCVPNDGNSWARRDFFLSLSNPIESIGRPLKPVESTWRMSPMSNTWFQKIRNKASKSLEQFKTELCQVWFHLFLFFQVAIRLAGPCRRQRPERVRMIIHRTTTGCSGTIKHSVSCLTGQHESPSFEMEGFGRESQLNLRSTWSV